MQHLALAALALATDPVGATPDHVPTSPLRCDRVVVAELGELLVTASSPEGKWIDFSANFSSALPFCMGIRSGNKCKVASACRQTDSPRTAVSQKH